MVMRIMGILCIRSVKLKGFRKSRSYRGIMNNWRCMVVAVTLVVLCLYLLLYSYSYSFVNTSGHICNDDKFHKPVLRRLISTNISNNVHQDVILINNLNQSNIGYPRNCSSELADERFMTILELKGRTGNNLFQLIALWAYAKKYCYTPMLYANPAYKLDAMKEIFNLKCFQVITNLKAKDPHVKTYTEGLELGTQYHPEIESLDTNYNWTLDGYFQSWKNFFDMSNYIKSMIIFNDHIISAAKQFIKDKNITHSLKICIHIRRGDMAWEDHQIAGFGVANSAYINNAIAFYKNIYINDTINFVILSDDIPWCKSNINITTNSYYSIFSTDSNKHKHSAGKDLALMSLCDHSIITSGTFGWLGAWLNGGKVIYYKGFPIPGTKKEKNTKREDYYPPDWIGMW